MEWMHLQVMKVKLTTTNNKYVMISMNVKESLEMMIDDCFSITWKENVNQMITDTKKNLDEILVRTRRKIVQ